MIKEQNTNTFLKEVGFVFVVHLAFYFLRGTFARLTEAFGVEVR